MSGVLLIMALVTTNQVFPLTPRPRAVPDNQEVERKFYADCQDFVRQAEKFVLAIGQSPDDELEVVGKLALQRWARIQSPSKAFPNTPAIRLVRVPVNDLAKFVGSQIMEIADSGHVGAVRITRRLGERLVESAQRSLKGKAN